MGHNRLTIPLSLDGLRQALPSQISVTDETVQALALLLGYCGGQRIPLQSSPSGVLFATSPRLVDVVHWTGVGANDTQQGDSIPCTEVFCMGHPDNAGKVWVRTRATATVNNAIPVAAGNAVVLTVNSLDEVHALIVTDGDKLIVGYSI